MRLSVLLGGAFAFVVAAQKISTNARCGSDGNGATCLGSRWGSCCSQYNYCGSTDAYCGTGCQSKFGTCKNPSPVQSSSIARSATPSPARSSVVSTPSSQPSQPVSKNARCGAGFGKQTCWGSQWGDCCSKYFYCGSTDDYCRPDSCQAGYGKCNPSSASPSPQASSSRWTTMGSSTLRSSSSPASSSPVASSTPLVPSVVSCGPQASSCANLPVASTASCQSVISKSKLRIATCERAGAVVTQIVTSQAAASTTTVTITSISSVAVTVPTTAIVTSTSTSLATEKVTITVPATITSVNLITATTTVSVSAPAQAQESVCTRSPVRLRNVDRAQIPSVCSCFLTSTKDSAASTVVATTIVSANTVVVTATTFVTVSTEVVQTIQQTEAALASSVITVADTAVATITQAATSVVSTVTATSTSYGDACATIRPLAGQPTFSSGTTQLRVGRDTNGPADCCRSCEQLSNCAWYSISYGGTYCQLYVVTTSPANACKSGKCKLGVLGYTGTTPVAGTSFYGGTCLAAAQGPV